MINYTALVTTVQQLIAATGRAVQVQQLAGGAADPGKPWRGAGVPTVQHSEAVTATFVPPGGGLGRDLVANEELLKRVSQVALVAPPVSGVDLEGYHVIVDNDVTWRIDWIQVLKPADTVLLYVFGVKR